jgi:branched-chain amino acid transport system substrate-binding protein
VTIARRLTDALSLAVVALVLAACGGSGGGSDAKALLIAVNAPFSGTPYVGETIANGAQLAVSGVNASGISISGDRYRLKLLRLDNRLSPRVAVDNVRRAIRAGAVAIVDEGTGVDASWRLAQDAHMPVGIVYQGGSGLVDAAERPNVFRIAPTDRGAAERYAEYLGSKKLRLALITDDSGYGTEGAKALDEALAEERVPISTRLVLPSGAADVRPQILEARRSRATALLVWAQPRVIAAVLTAARSTGWKVPVYTSPTGEDPLIRQQLSDHSDWVDGLTFASGRMTAEVGPGPFLSFQKTYEHAFGAQRVGVRTPDGAEVVQPPDYAMYSYDFVNVVVAALRKAGAVDGRRIVSQLERVNTQGANGDEREFDEENHEGVKDDDVYFARFRQMTFRPVKDDPLSASLPVIGQRRPAR